MSGPAASLWRSVRAVAWSFIGIRKSSESQHDLAQVHPLQFIAVGIAGALALVGGLVLLVHWVAR